MLESILPRSKGEKAHEQRTTDGGQVHVYVVVNFLSQVIFVFLLFLGMLMYANEVDTKEKKNYLR